MLGSVITLKAYLLSKTKHKIQKKMLSYYTWYMIYIAHTDLCTWRQIHYSLSYPRIIGLRKGLLQGLYWKTKAKLMSIKSSSVSVAERMFPCLCSESHRHLVIELSLAEFSIQASHADIKEGVPECV